jgi:peptide/nickel transport system ATP-binding protein
MSLLDIRQMSVLYRVGGRDVAAVDRLDLSLDAGRTLVIVGESGCGKSATALGIMGLLPPAPDAKVTGSVKLDGKELVGLEPAELRAVRGRKIAMIFQEPMTSLNPVLTVGEQITEAILAHESVSARAARSRAAELLEMVRVPGGASRLDEYPHRFSGGMRQRILIAIAMACRPQVLLADEPTTALDVTIQAQILDLLAELGERFGMAMILITHDLGVVARMADEVVVMYAGRKVEQAPVDDFFARPSHPYTFGLLGASPHRSDGRRGGDLAEIRGIVPGLRDLPAGCAFAPRCPRRFDPCGEQPPAVPVEAKHLVACHLYGAPVHA